MRQGISGFSALCLALLAGGCGNGKSPSGDNSPVLLAGGQSGTEGQDSFKCAPPPARTICADEELLDLRASLRTIAANLAQSRFHGLWLAGGQRADLSFELDPEQPARFNGEAGRSCTGVVELEALHVHSSDGLLDVSVPARLTGGIGVGGPSWLLDATLPTLPDAYYGPERQMDVDKARAVMDFFSLGPVGGSPGLLVSFPMVDTVAAVYDEQRPLGLWAQDLNFLPWGPPVPFTPKPVFAEACAGFERLQDPDPNMSLIAESPAPASISGAWARCSDNVPADHDGIELLPDGSWRLLKWQAGELVALSGFAHEGKFTLGGSDPNLRYVDFAPWARDPTKAIPSGEFIAGVRAGALVFAADPASQWPSAVYQPTSLPVRVIPPEYADGERAGSTACGRPEHDLVPSRAETAPPGALISPGSLASLGELAPLLSGDFVLCEGHLEGDVAALHFEPGLVELRRKDGSVLDRQAYVPANGLVFASRAWALAMSRQPLKLWITESSLLDDAWTNAVFSALP